MIFLVIRLCSLRLVLCFKRLIAEGVFGISGSRGSTGQYSRQPRRTVAGPAAGSPGSGELRILSRPPARLQAEADPEAIIRVSLLIPNRRSLASGWPGSVLRPRIP